MVTLANHQTKNTTTSIIQDYLRKNNIFAVLIRSTDQYFNEYVPLDQSIRAQVTGFKGSVGDAIITTNSAHLFIDGRYVLQAAIESPSYEVQLCQSGQSIESGLINFLVNNFKKNGVIAYDPSVVDLALFERLSHNLAKVDMTLSPVACEIFAKCVLNKKETAPKPYSLWQIDREISGELISEKIAKMRPFLLENELDGFFIVKLDDIAWLSNLRGDYFPFQRTMPAKAAILPHKLIIALDKKPTNKLSSLDKSLEIVDSSEFLLAIEKEIPKKNQLVLGIDAKECSKQHEIDLQLAAIRLKRLGNPVAPLKAIKNEEELLHMRQAIKQADLVVYETQAFVENCFKNEESISEAHVDEFVQNRFKESGACSLSFRPICASDKNAAIIHYGTPNNTEKIVEGTLFLLDTGAYYQGGYATDLTRTFLAARSNTQALAWQKKMFTLVLKASIKGMSARLRKGSVGEQLDALVREPLWQLGLDFAHGTGHGVGINVHEFPPRIAPGSHSPLLVGQVFSIEPGLYFKGLGGVRIENLVTIVEDPKNKDFIRVLPLSFCPLDQRLIDYDMLNSFEQRFLSYYAKEWQDDKPMPALAPLDEADF